jgi:hypothetical protein
MIRIASLDGEKGLEYGVGHTEKKGREVRDRFFLSVVRDYYGGKNTQARQAAIASFMDYVRSTSNAKLLGAAISTLGGGEDPISVCKDLIQYGMIRPSNEQAAIMVLRHMALGATKDQRAGRIQPLADWVATQFKGTPLAACAVSITADAYYCAGRYVEALRAVHPSLFQVALPEAKMMEDLEAAVSAFRRGTLCQGMIDLKLVYSALGEEAFSKSFYAVACYCYRKVAGMQGGSLEAFKQSAVKEVTDVESAPQSQMWFWKGMIAAESGDLSAAAEAYERFLSDSHKSIFTAKACWDIARAKMAMGEDPTDWIARAKALSPCDVVIQLEQKLNPQAASQRQE